MSRVVIVVLAALAGAMLVGALVAVIDQRSGPPVVISDLATDEPIVVYIDGAVATPGLLELPADARLGDAVDAAGGLTDEADLGQLNPATRLHDGDRVTIAALAPTGAAISIAAGTTTAQSIALDINAASVAELEALPNIGEVLAERIVAYRETHGPFTTVDDLLLVDGVSPGDLEALRPLIGTSP